MADKRARRKRRKEKHQLWQGKVHAKGVEIFRKMGIQGNIPHHMTRILGRTPKIHFPSFRIEAKGKELEALEELRSDVADELAAPGKCSEGPLSVAEYFGTIVPYIHRLDPKLAPLPDDDEWDAVGDTIGKIGDFVKKTGEFWIQELGYCMQRAVIRNSRIDWRLFTVTFEEPYPGELNTAFRLRSSLPETRKIDVDGHSRLAYRLGATVSVKALEWAEIDTQALGISGPPRKLPVYVQSHALERLRERIEGRTLEGHRHMWLFMSFKEPKVTRREKDGEFLLEFRWSTTRLGHVLVTIVNDVALVRTFLFLTMSGTPEATRLRQKLKLARKDIDRFELASLNTFLVSDLRDDPELVRMFDDCGIGHLFTFIPAEGEPEMQIAGELRRHFGLAPRAGAPSEDESAADAAST
ncbi:hypothetical protein HY251_15610 [bacterium]|nr:hypothetical protein [bacterium]